MAGSCTNQLAIFYNLINSLKVPIQSAFRMLSENPANFVNLNHVGIFFISLLNLFVTISYYSKSILLRY
jgi:N-acetylglucosamine-6-phosphate deacetylase